MIPPAVLASVWASYAVICVAISIGSFFFLRYHLSPYEYKRGALIICSIALTIVLSISALIATDVALISSFKLDSGVFENWADNSTISEAEDQVEWIYYSYYAVVALFAFLILPMNYFYLRYDEEEYFLSRRLCGALKYTIFFVIVACVLLCLGAFLPMEYDNTNFNGTAWQNFEAMVHDIGRDNGQDAITFLIGAVTMVGLVLVVVYTGYGSAAWPIAMLKGTKHPKDELNEILSQYSQSMSGSDNVERVESSDSGASRSGVIPSNMTQSMSRTMQRRQKYLEERLSNRAYQIWWKLSRPVEVLCGVLFLLLGGGVFVSLLLGNIDKAMHSAGAKSGYQLVNASLPNPIDLALVHTEKLFPLNLIIYGLIIFYLLASTMFALRVMGVRCLCVKLYQIKARRTRPQGLIFLCFITLFIVLSINMLVYEIIPTYTMFGSQRYVNANGTTVPCDLEAVPGGECIMSRISLIVSKYYLLAWFFGAIYYFLSWAFLLVFLVGFVVAILRPAPSSLNEAQNVRGVDLDDEEGLFDD